MKVKITSTTRVVVPPQEIEVNEAEAQRLIMMGVAIPCLAKEVPEQPIVKETRDIPEKEIKKQTKKGKK